MADADVRQWWRKAVGKQGVNVMEVLRLEQACVRQEKRATLPQATWTAAVLSASSCTREP